MKALMLLLSFGIIAGCEIPLIQNDNEEKSSSPNYNERPVSNQICKLFPKTGALQTENIWISNDGAVSARIDVLNGQFIVGNNWIFINNIYHHFRIIDEYDNDLDTGYYQIWSDLNLNRIYDPNNSNDVVIDHGLYEYQCDKIVFSSNVNGNYWELR